MVLEEATTSQEPAAYSETLPTSDLDPYSSSSTEILNARPSSFVRLEQSGEPVYINLQSLPQPFSFARLFFAQELQQGFGRGITATCRYASNILQRPLRQEEADAFAFHWARSIRLASFGGPIGILTAMVIGTTGGRMQKYRFPGGWTPLKEGSRFSIDKFLSFRGRLARVSWQWTRLTAYGMIGSILGNIFMASYALTIHQTGRAQDTRLKDWNEAIKNVDRTRAVRAMQEGNQQVQRAESAGSGETFEMARQRRGVQQQQQRQQAGMQEQQSWGGRRRVERKKMDDDMSPTGGAFEEEFMGFEDSGHSGLMSDGRVRQQQQQQNAAMSSLDSSSSTADQRSQPRSSADSTKSPQNKSTSSWERLRQSAMSGNASSQQRSQPSARSSDGSSGSDSFSFSQNDEDKQLAKSEAQREFDSRIEREREGRNFDDKGGGGKW